MPSETGQSGRVLIVDDEEQVARLYAEWLGTDHDVVSATGGEQALDCVDPSIDVIFLDRQMPTLSGDEVLERLDERNVDCRVVLVTAVEPDFDIVAMPFDAYLTKPVTEDELSAAVSDMLARDTYDGQLQQYFALVSKKATLDSQMSRDERNGNDGYLEITDRVEELRQQVDATAAQFDTYDGLFRELPGST